MQTELCKACGEPKHCLMRTERVIAFVFNSLGNLAEWSIRQS
jgi:hypothetical protein